MVMNFSVKFLKFNMKFLNPHAWEVRYGATKFNIKFSNFTGERSETLSLLRTFLTVYFSRDE